MRYLIFFFLAASFAANAQTAAELLSGQDFLGFNTEPVTYMVRNWSASQVQEYAALSLRSGVLTADTGYLTSRFDVSEATVSYTAAGEQTINATNKYGDSLKIVLVLSESNWNVSYIRLVQRGNNKVRTWLEWYNN